jgi:hypothetical protein
MYLGLHSLDADLFKPDPGHASERDSTVLARAHLQFQRKRDGAADCDVDILLLDFADPVFSTVIRYGPEGRTGIVKSPVPEELAWRIRPVS